jgi:hypothetical protein
VKTDARDAEHIARLLLAGKLHQVRVPGPEEEALRDLVRARETLRLDLMRARHRLSKLLLRHGVQFDDGRAWTERHRAWLQTVEDGEALVAVLEAVAVRTGVRAGPPYDGESGDVGDLVEHPCGQENCPRRLGTTSAGDSNGAVEDLHVLDFEGHHLDAVAYQLGAAAGTELGGVQPVVA